MTVRRREGWTTAADLVRSFTYRSGTADDRLALLSGVWEKECGAFARHWALAGVRKGTLYVRPRSSAAGQELFMRSEGLIKALNKYFRRPWITAVRTTHR